MESVKHERYLWKGNMITDDSKFILKIKFWIAVTKAAFIKKWTVFTSKLDLNLKKKLVKCYIWSTASYGVQTWTLRKGDRKYLERAEIWC